MKKLLSDIRACQLCQEHLPWGARPVVQGSPNSRILIIGQAPGRKVHASGIPWDDLSGQTLREWLGVGKADFYNPDIFGIMPMGFCYPGTGPSGDWPPRRECAPTWHTKMRLEMPQIELTLLIGQYAQAYYLDLSSKQTLTETVSNWEAYWPTFLPMPHPSPRNRMWRRKNNWFEQDVVPVLQARVKNVVVND